MDKFSDDQLNELKAEIADVLKDPSVTSLKVVITKIEVCWPAADAPSAWMELRRNLFDVIGMLEKRQIEKAFETLSYMREQP